MKKIIIILLGFGIFYSTTANAGFGKTKEAWTVEIEWAIDKAEDAKSDSVLKLKKLQKEFTASFDKNYAEGTKYKFYEFAAKQFKLANEILKNAKLPTIITPNWL